MHGYDDAKRMASESISSAERNFDQPYSCWPRSDPDPVSISEFIEPSVNNLHNPFLLRILKQLVC